MPTQDQVFEFIAAEEAAQHQQLRLIPSENYASPQVHQALGSVLSHKYAEGYPGKRYYQGNYAADGVESLCRNRALQAFKLDPQDWGVNVQAYSGSTANLAVYDALIKPGDTIMAMYLPDGGHLSHGWKYKDFATHVGKIYQIEYYHVSEKTQVFDYDAIQKKAEKIKPKLLISGGTAYPRDIDHQRMGQIAAKVGAFYLADISHESGLVAAGLINQPFPHADAVMCTTHKTLRGARGALLFGRKQSRVNAQLDVAAAIDKAIFPGLQGGPHLHTIAANTVALGEVLEPDFIKYAQQIIANTQALAARLLEHGYTLVSDGGDKHLLLLDFTHSKVEPWIASWALEFAGIIVNRNTVPNEQGSPYYPSGIRIGTPILSTRGMTEPDMVKVADWFHQVVEYSAKWQLPSDKTQRTQFLKDLLKTELPKDDFLIKIKKQVTEFAMSYPTFAWSK